MIKTRNNCEYRKTMIAQSNAKKGDSDFIYILKYIKYEKYIFVNIYNTYSYINT